MPKRVADAASMNETVTKKKTEEIEVEGKSYINGTEGHIFLAKLPKEDSGPSYRTSTWSIPDGSQLQIADQNSCIEWVEALQGAQGTKGHIFSNIVTLRSRA